MVHSWLRAQKITPGVLREPDEMLDIKPRSATCKVNSILTILLLRPCEASSLQNNYFDFKSNVTFLLSYLKYLFFLLHLLRFIFIVEPNPVYLRSYFYVCTQRSSLWGWETMCGVRDWTQGSCMQSKHPTCYIFTLSPAFKLSYSFISSLVDYNLFAYSFISKDHHCCLLPHFKFLGSNNNLLLKQ